MANNRPLFEGIFTIAEQEKVFSLETLLAATGPFSDTEYQAYAEALKKYYSEKSPENREFFSAALENPDSLQGNPELKCFRDGLTHADSEIKRITRFTICFGLLDVKYQSAFAQALFDPGSTINLIGNNLADDEISFKRICQILPSCRAWHVDASDNNLGYLSPDLYMEFFKALAAMPQLNSLNLKNTGLPYKFKIFCDYLNKTKVTSLDLRDNRLAENLRPSSNYNPIQHFCTMLANSKLVVLNLADWKIFNNSDAAAICTATKDNYYLRFCIPNTSFDYTKTINTILSRNIAIYYARKHGSECLQNFSRTDAKDLPPADTRRVSAIHLTEQHGVASLKSFFIANASDLSAEDYASLLNAVVEKTLQEIDAVLTILKDDSSDKAVSIFKEMQELQLKIQSANFARPTQQMHASRMSL